MKKLTWMVLIVFIFLMVNMAAAEDKDQTLADKWNVNLNGQTIKVQPVTVEGKILLPLLPAADAMGLKVIVDKMSKTLILLGDLSCDKNYPGLVEGTVKINLPKGNPMLFVGVQAVLTAVSNKPDTIEELRHHFYGKKDDYFLHHFPQAKAVIDLNGKFYILDVPPGEYDLLIFNKTDDTFGSHRVCWKLFVKIDPGRVTKVCLDRYDVSLYDYILFHK